MRGRKPLAGQKNEDPARQRPLLGLWMQQTEKERGGPASVRRRPSRAGGAGRAARNIALGGLAAVLALGAAFFFRLALGPIPVSGFAPQIAEALAGRFGKSYVFSLGGTAIELEGLTPALTIHQLSIKEPSGRTILTAPRAEVSVDPIALLGGSVTPKRLEIFDVVVHLTLRADGSLALPLSGAGESVDLIPPVAPALGAQPLAQQPDAGVQGSPRAGAKPSRSVLVKRLAAFIRRVVDSLTDPANPAAAIDRIGIGRGKVIIADETAGQTLTFSGVDLNFGKTSGGRSFELSADGPNGRWSASGAASGVPGSERGIMLAVSNLSLDEILLAAGTRTIGADFDMPLSGRLDLRLSSDGAISLGAAQFEFGSGYLRLDDPDDEPMMVDKISGGFHWETAGRRIAVDYLRLTAGATHYAFAGSVATPMLEGDPWSISLTNSEPNETGPSRPGEKPILIDHAGLTAQLYLSEKRLRIERLSFSGPQCGFAAAGVIDWFNGPRVRLGASISPTPVAIALRLWPSLAGARVRSWLLARAREGMVTRGTMQIDFDSADLLAMRAGRAPPDSKILVDFAIADGGLEFLPGVPPLRAIEGAGHVTGRSAAFSVSGASLDPGNGRLLTLSNGTFRAADTDLSPVPAEIETRVAASVEAIGALLAHDALKPYAILPLDPAAVKGQAEGTLGIKMSLGAGAASSGTAVTVTATVANFSAENLLGGQKLEGGTLWVSADPAGFKATGHGNIFGAPATIAIDKSSGKPAEASIGIVLDDEMRAKLGFAFLSGLSGPVAAKISSPLGTGEKPSPKIDIDLSGAAIEVPGISKPAGRPGKITFTLVTNEAATSLDHIIVDAGPVQARGRVDLGPGYSLLAASFPQVKLSPGDDMRVDITGAGESVKVAVRGSTIDARPFLRSLIFSPPGEAAAPAAASDSMPPATASKDIEFDVRSAILSGYNKQAVTGAELRFAKRGGQIRQFSFAGTFGGQPISSNLVGGGPAPQINLMTEDAGSLLSFLDLYKHMEHGRLAVGMIAGTDTLNGVLVISDFVLRDEPALRRLVIEGAPPQDASGGARRIDTGAIAFNKLQVRFQRDGSRLVLSEGSMQGQAIGLTVEGVIDFVHDSVDMKGTFVPIYAFNNMFAQIPVVGLILGGATDEGLIGVNYRITGQASAPTLSINPLSAITPGIFRQIFGVVDFDPMHPQR
jgi:hypothetical protein